MKSMKGPFATIGVNKQVAANVPVPLVATVSGEITASKTGIPLGAVMTGGRVSNVWLSVLKSGKDDTNTLKITGDVFINGTSCVSTNPYISHVSGEASQQKTTKISGDTGIVQAVMNTSANTVSPGDVITCDIALTRVASPTTEMANPALVVEFEPII